MDLRKIWKNKKQIAEGIKNNIFKKEHIEEVAKARMQLCNNCPHIDLNGNKCEMAGTQPCCSLCGCTLKFKVRSLSSGCPAESPKWLPLTTSEQEDQINININYNQNNGDTI